LVERRRRLDLTVRAMTRCSAVVTVSRAAAVACHRWLGVEADVIYPGVDLEGFSPGGSRSEAPTIFCAAAVDQPHKRLDLLLDAYRLARRERSDVRLVLLRPPRTVEDRIHSSDPSVEFVDPVESDLAPHYRRAWISVLPSVGEAFGLVLAESLACGTPVVGSHHGGIPEVIDRAEIGRVFEPDDEHGLSRAMLEALELAEMTETPAACARRAADFSTGRSADAYEQLYVRLLDRA
jgi:glycosyltransferase involved in cell wall biosynthesis